MTTFDTMPRMYESLADHYARQGESRQRDQCLVLAADAALTAGMPEEAERLRRRLLLTNPHHLVRPYSSMAEAMKAKDVRDLVAGLRKQLPPEAVEKMLNNTAGTAPLAAPTKAEKGRQAASAPAEPVSPFSVGLSLILFTLGLVLIGGLAVITFAGPWLP